MAWQHHQRQRREFIMQWQNLVPFVVNAPNATNGERKGVSDVSFWVY